jgi:hypothetical protein
MWGTQFDEVQPVGDFVSVFLASMYHPLSVCLNRISCPCRDRKCGVGTRFVVADATNTLPGRGYAPCSLA